MFINSKSKFKRQNPKQFQGPGQKGKPFDLGERTALFGEQVIILMNKVFRNDINRPLINQLVRSATSIGANYMEADGAVSKRDFRNKLATSRKEAKETRHGLRMLAQTTPTWQRDFRQLSGEAHEITCILSAIINKI